MLARKLTRVLVTSIINLRTLRNHFSEKRQLLSLCTGIGRFRILGVGGGTGVVGVARFRVLGPRGGANSQQAHGVVTASMRRNNVASTSFRHHVPTRFLINQCQIITFLM